MFVCFFQITMQLNITIYRLNNLNFNLMLKPGQPRLFLFAVRFLLCSPVVWIPFPRQVCQTASTWPRMYVGDHCEPYKRAPIRIVSLWLRCSSNRVHPDKARKNFQIKRNAWPCIGRLFSATSSFLVTTLKADGSRLEAVKTSFNWASFFSKMSEMAPNFFSSNKFLRLLFCWTSWMALTNLLYNSSLSFLI